MNTSEQQHSRNEQQHLRNKRQCLENEQQKLKSIPSPTAPAFATFRNCSPRIVNILWLNFKGDSVTYTKDGLNPRRKMDMNTYEGHPWIFRDYDTGDKLLIITEADNQRREVFFPVPWSENNSQRTQVTILLPVYTLKERSLQVIRSLIQNKADFEKLEIPVTLQSQLANPEDMVKWYLGGNCITVLEGFEKLEQLKELHIEHQRIPKGEKLLFDPQSLASLSVCLQVLNVSGNRLDDITDLRLLLNLTQFMGGDNKLRDLRNVIAWWPHLWRLELTGNPLCHKAKYRDRVIVMNESLAVLDGKEINQTEKAFLMRWKDAKETKRKQREEAEQRRSDLDVAPSLPVAGAGRDLPPVMPPKGSKSKPGGLKNIYIMPSMVGGKKRFEAVLAKSQSLPNSASQLEDSHSYTTPMRQIVAPGLIRKSQSDLERSARAMMMHERRHPILRQATSLGLSSGDAHPSMNGNHIVPTSVIL